ncbi:DUF1837 domain-containing protein [Pseudomonas sp. 50_B]|uniref:HamA C-terminal domain-containing protein n=1 Tax=Pseudomonas sp. 50_B TaxID=2813574 RepID=UPI001A9F4495|nr:DUF1837 domain-containing protein [Pseudomonas sp. 50_B]
MSRPFKSNGVIEEFFSENNLRCYIVGYDLEDHGGQSYRWKPLVKTIISAIHEFAFGLHESAITDNTETVEKVVEAAKSIYKIENFENVKNIYLNGKHIADDIEDKYLRRGEFGELILHLLLRDYHQTIPLLSKIYFKDSYGFTVHGFDSVHINPNTKTLWLGESKLYIDPVLGVKALIEDLKEHITSDYLNSEFNIITKKTKHFDFHPDVNYWTEKLSTSEKLKTRLNSIVIPMLCTYSSKSFANHNDDELEIFKKDLTAEINTLQQVFLEKNDHPLREKINILLMFFPVKCKNELVKRLHTKLSLLQAVGD